MDTMATAAARPSAKIYPLPETNASRVLVFIRENPGTSTNNVITGLRMNPTVVRKCIANLLEHNKISDKVNDQGHHSYTVKTKW